MKRIYLALLVVLGMQHMYANSNTEKPIVVVIPSYNNSQWYRQNLDSVLSQKYDNYRVIYINDCSSDNTGTLVADYINRADAHDRITFIDNTVRHGALANLYRAIHTCDDRDIVITLDGDDWFAHDGVLARINAEYQDPTVWLTYGQFKTHPQNSVGFCRDLPPSIIKGSLFREYEWVTSHPRTFYAALFKQVQLKELLYEQAFFDVTWDMAFMYPMLEMAGEHCRFIPDVLYVYNQGNPLNDFRQKVVRQIRCKYYVASKQKYSPIATLAMDHTASTDLLLFSGDTPQQLARCLVQLERHLDGVERIIILYRESAHTRAVYADLRKQYPYLTFCSVDDSSFKPELMRVLCDTENPYVLFMQDTIAVHESCDLHACADALAQTKAYGCYFAVGKNDAHAPLMVVLHDDLYAWQFKYGRSLFKHPHSAQMALYCKDSIRKKVAELPATHVTQLIQGLNDELFDCEQVGLCFEHPKAKRVQV